MQQGRYCISTEPRVAFIVLRRPGLTTGAHLQWLCASCCWLCDKLWAIEQLQLQPLRPWHCAGFGTHSLPPTVLFLRSAADTTAV
jgi:hypothetical protein